MVLMFYFKDFLFKRPISFEAAICRVFVPVRTKNPFIWIKYPSVRLAFSKSSLSQVIVRLSRNKITNKILDLF